MERLKVCGMLTPLLHTLLCAAVPMRKPRHRIGVRSSWKVQWKTCGAARGEKIGCG